MLKIVAFLSLSLLFNFQSKDQEEWVLKKDKDGIKVFTRKTLNFKFDELKVECEFEGRLSQMVGALLDVSNHCEWVYKTSKAQLLKTINPTSLFFYTEIECPWPFENRDVVVHLNLVQNSQTKVITVESKSVNNYLPQQDNVIRMKYSQIICTITPVNDKRFKVEYIIRIDPGGSVPAWLLNLFATKGPYESFRKLKEEINLPKYKKAKFPFILD